MLYLITGGSGSGKSEYAETLAVHEFAPQHGQGGLFYVATMQPYDDECVARIERHRNMRKEKGFTTIECQTHLERVNAGKQDVLLLECMSNLLANEMYFEQGRIRGRGERALPQLEEAVLKPLRFLKQSSGGLVIVTNEVFSDGVQYDEETMNYIGLLGRVNQELAAMADAVIEVVCSIPLAVKGELPCLNP